MTLFAHVQAYMISSATFLFITIVLTVTIFGNVQSQITWYPKNTQDNISVFEPEIFSTTSFAQCMKPIIVHISMCKIKAEIHTLICLN